MLNRLFEYHIILKKIDILLDYILSSYNKIYLNVKRKRKSKYTRNYFC